MRPASNGSRSVSSTCRSNSGSSSRNSTPRCARVISRVAADCVRRRAPPRWTNGAERGTAAAAIEPVKKPDMLADSSAAEVNASSSVIAGNKLGRRAASIDFPAPGGPTSARDGRRRLRPRAHARARAGRLRRSYPAGRQGPPHCPPTVPRPATAARPRRPTNARRAMAGPLRRTRRRPVRAASPALAAGRYSSGPAVRSRGIAFRTAAVLYRTGRAACGSTCHREGAAHRAQRARQRQLPRKFTMCERLGRNLPARSENAERDGKIEAAGFLRQIGGGEVDGDATDRKVQTAVLQRSPHAFAASRTSRSGRPTIEKDGKPFAR